MSQSERHDNAKGGGGEAGTPLLADRLPAVPPPRPIIALRVVDGVTELKLPWSASRRTLTLGSARVPSVDLRFTAPGVSRHHLTLQIQGNQLEVIDAGSRNGIYFADQRETSGCVSAGDIFRIAGTSVIALDDDLLQLRPHVQRVIGYEAHAAVHTAIARLAATKPLVLLGRLGCDHAAFARAIHQFSKRREGPFAEVAADERPFDKLLERAWGGTVFVDLDAAGTLSASFVTSLLAPATHVRLIVAATSWRAVEVAFGKERARFLAPWIIELPPLSTRAADVPRIVDALFATEMGSTRSVTELGPENVQALIAHNWRDNIAGLRRVADKLHARIVSRNTAEAAALVGVTPQAFWSTMTALGLVFPDPRRRDPDVPRGRKP